MKNLIPFIPFYPIYLVLRYNEDMVEALQNPWINNLSAFAQAIYSLIVLYILIFFSNQI